MLELEGRIPSLIRWRGMTVGVDLCRVVNGAGQGDESRFLIFFFK